MKAKVIIFDCDGVLLDNELAMAELNVEVLNGIGGAFTVEQYAGQFIGLSDDEWLRILAEEYGLRPSAEVLERLLALETDAKRAASKPMRGVEGVLRSIGESTCVASNSQSEQLTTNLSAGGLLGFFEGRIFSASLVARGKPFPDLFLYAAAALRVAPADCLVVEDSVSGIVAARAAAMRVIGFTGGAHMFAPLARRIEDAGPDAVVTSMSELASLLRANSQNELPT
jgi:HAD superfamily hydrolase (TIGR01509 family)